MKLPHLSISAKPRTLIEDQGTKTRIVITANRKIPRGGIEVCIDTDKVRGLGDFEIDPSPSGLKSIIKGGKILFGEADNSGFTFLMTGKRTTITLPVFDDDDIVGSTVNSDKGREKTTFRITDAPNGDYTIGKKGKVTFTFFDSKSSLVAFTDGLDDSFDGIEQASTVAGNTGENALQSGNRQDVISSLENNGLVSIERQTTGSSSLSQRSSSLDSGLEAEALTITDASTLSESKFFTVEDV